MKKLNYLSAALPFCILLILFLFQACTQELEMEPAQESKNLNIVEIDTNVKPDAAARAVQTSIVKLNKIRVWLYRGSEATGTFLFKIRRISDGALMAQSKSLAVSTLALIPNQLSTNTGKIIFALNGNTLDAREMYRIEVVCSNVVRSSDPSSKKIYWGAKPAPAFSSNMGIVVSTTSGGTTDIPFTDVTDAVFETEYFDDNGDTFVDQSQAGIGVLKVINEMSSVPSDLTRLAAWQKFRAPKIYRRSEDFVTTWKTDAPGGLKRTDNYSITIPGYPGVSPKYDVDWNNDGVFDEFNLETETKHRYDQPGIYTVRIRGSYHSFDFDFFSYDHNKLLSVDQWGSQKWQTLRFNGCVNFDIKASDVPNLSELRSTYNMFNGCRSFNAYIGDWDMSNVTSMDYMFRGATSFNQDISDWDVSKVDSMEGMFESATSFNQDIRDWNVSNVQFMKRMFKGATSFNRNIGNWDVSKSENMEELFAGATAFNQNIGNWNVSNVRSMYRMFYNATAFNQNVGNWDVRKAYYMPEMFSGALAFSQANYDRLLIGWSQQVLLENAELTVDTQFCSEAADVARAKMISNFNWHITDRGRNPSCE